MMCGDAAPCETLSTLEFKSIARSLSDDEIEIVCASFPKLTALRTEAMISVRGIEILTSKLGARLRTLELGPYLKNDAAKYIATNCPNLTELKLPGFGIDFTDAQMDVIVSSLLQLRILDLSGARYDTSDRKSAA